MGSRKRGRFLDSGKLTRRDILLASEMFSEPDFETILRAILFEFQQDTEKRIEGLRMMGSSENAFPLKLERFPWVDTVINPIPLNKSKPFRIEVGGVIGAGKDSALEVIDPDWLSNFSQETHIIPDAATLLKEKEKVRPGVPKIMLAKMSRDLDFVFPHFFGDFFEKGELANYIYNRGSVDDTAFAQALLINEIIKYPEFYEATTDFRKPNAIFIFLVNPFEGLWRKMSQLGVEEHSTLLNPDFMLTLYDQYLRLIFDLIKLEQENLVVINGNRSKEEVRKVFLSLLQQVLTLS